MEIKTVQQEVFEILTKYPEARDSDERLYGIYLTGRIGLVSAIEFFNNFSKKYSNIASFSTISRVRRKVQELHPPLASSEETKEARDELQFDFFNYVKGR